MDASRFDALSRVVGSQTHRRNMLKTMAAGALGLVGLSALRDDASARSCNRNRDCPNRLPKCKNGTCVECLVNSDCPSGSRCNNKNECVRR